MEQHGEDRKEPEVEINDESEDYTSPLDYQKPKRTFSLKKWVLFPILLLGTTGLAFGLWMILQSGIFSGKKQPETPELNSLRTEVQKLKGEIASLKNEFQFLKEEQKAIQEWTKVLQGQVTAFKGQLTVLAKKKDSQGDKKPKSKVVVYKIQKGDTLVSIAKKFRVDQDDLRNWNRLPSKGNLKPGQTITIYSPTP
jgi:LysM repeat protein